MISLTLGLTGAGLLRAQELERERDHPPERERELREHGEPERDRDDSGERERGEPRRENAPRENRMEMLHREIEELHRHGRHEEAGRLERRLARESRERRGPEGSPDREMHELHRRLHHLNVAIEHLRIAEFHEPAEALERQAHDLREALERRARQPHPEHGRPPGGPEPGPHPGPELEALHQQMREMRGQMEEMHRALRDIHGRLERRD